MRIAVAWVRITLMICAIVGLIPSALRGSSREKGRLRAIPVSGTYRITRGDKPLGIERYQWSVDSTGAGTLVGDWSLVTEQGSTTLNFSLVTDSKLCPVMYLRSTPTREGTTWQKRLKLQFKDSRVKIVQIVGTTELYGGQHRIKDPDLVFDSSFLCLYLMVVARYDTLVKGNQDLDVYDLQFEDYAAHVKMRGLGSVTNENGTFRAHRMTIEKKGHTIDLYVDDHGLIPRISIPSMKVEALLEGYNGR